MDYFLALVYPEGESWISKKGSQMITAKFKVYKHLDENGEEEMIEDFDRRISFCLLDKNIDKDGNELQGKDRIPDKFNPFMFNSKRLLRLGFNGNISNPQFSNLNDDFKLKLWKDKKGYDQWEFVDPEIELEKEKEKKEKQEKEKEIMSVSQSRWDKMFGDKNTEPNVSAPEPTQQTEPDPTPEPAYDYTKDEMIAALSKMDIDKLPADMVKGIREKRGRSWKYDDAHIFDWTIDEIIKTYEYFVGKGFCEKARKIIDDGKDVCDAF